jgi:hypothetical protein
LQLIGVLLNGWVHHEFMIPRSIGFDLLPNVFVKANEPFVGHIFHAHDFKLPRTQSLRGGYPASVRRSAGY